jgi:DNA-binding IscR family transcriptional regulator
MVIDEVWSEIRTTVERRLAAITLDDLCQRKRSRDGAVMYYI